MEETGIVKSIDGEIAHVAVQKNSGCRECASKALCMTQNDETALIEAFNMVRATVGQKVLVDMKAYSYVQGSILVYGLPASFLLLGAIVGKYVIAKLFVTLNAEVLSAITGFTFLAISLIIMKLVTGKMEKNTQLRPVITRIID